MSHKKPKHRSSSKSLFKKYVKHNPYNKYIKKFSTAIIRGTEKRRSVYTRSLAPQAQSVPAPSKQKNTHMSVAVKRKRGRPRNDEPREINDFDLTLIEEFRSRPAFYDRTHPQYRNREFLEPQWLDMSRNLGYNVSLIKNRMIQLRNRYNLEKRRVEALREQYNDPDITSQWLLYPNLTFLGTHIKSRRTCTKQELLPKEPPASNSSDADDDSQHFENGNITDHQSDINSPPQEIDPIATAVVAATAVATATADAKKSNELNNYSTVPTFVRIPLHATVATSSVVSTSNSNTQSQSQSHIQIQSQSNSSDKFKAFGQFLASSLIEMDEKDALRLVEKFTSDLCKSLLSEQHSNLKQLRGNSDTDMGGISV